MKTTILTVVALTIALTGYRLGGEAFAGDPALAQQTGTAQQYPGPEFPPSDEQMAILADGVVTDEEVRAALNRAADCLESFGVPAVRVGHPQLEGNLELMSFVPDGGDFARTSAAMRECSLRHSAGVTSTYRRQNRGSTPSNPVLDADGWPVNGPARQEGWPPSRPSRPR